MLCFNILIVALRHIDCSNINYIKGQYYAHIVMADYVERVYSDTGYPAAFTSPRNIQKAIPGSRLTDVKTQLEAVDAYTKHKPVRHRFQRRKTLGGGRFLTCQADLVDMSKTSSHNDGYKFLVTLIDVYTRMLFVRCLKNKSGVVVASALEDIFQEFVPSFLYTDQGKEFYNPQCRALFERLGLTHASPDSAMKAAMVERANRTLKTRLSKYMTHNNKPRYIDVLDNVVTGINNSFHRGIGMKPVDVTSNIFKESFVISQKKPRFHIGDFVRISMSRSTFQKGYTAGFSEELFCIASVFLADPVTYKLKDYSGEDVGGIFYTEELSRARNTDDVWKIETIVARRTHQGKQQVLVKWLGYNDTFNKWIDADDLINL